MSDSSWWNIKQTPPETKQLCEQLREAIKNDAEEEVIAILNEPGVVRGLVVRRGSANEYVKTVTDAFEYFQTKTKDFKSLLAYFQRKKLSEYLIWEWMSAFYRLKNRKLMREFEKLNTQVGELVKNNAVKGLIQHELATWSAEMAGDYERSVELNKRALEFAHQGEDALVPIRIKFGLTDHKGRRLEKGLSPKKRIEDFTKYGKLYRSHNDLADAWRAEIEVASAMFESATAKLPAPDFALLAQAEELAKKIHSQAKEFQYVNLIVYSKELLGAIAEFRGKDKIAKRYFKEAEKLRLAYDYSKPPNK
jgi:hypothetical protein